MEAAHPVWKKKLNLCSLGLSKHNKEASSGAPEFKCPQGGLWVIVYPWNMVCLVPCLIICASMPRWKGGSVCFCSAQKSRFFVRGQGSFFCWSCFHCYGDAFGASHFLTLISDWFWDYLHNGSCLVHLEKLFWDQCRRNELSVAMETDVTFWINKE